MTFQMGNEYEYEKLGYCKETNKGTYKIKKEKNGIGYAFKDGDAFYNWENVPCYAGANYKKNTYDTAKDILEVCDGQEEIADMVFSMLDWQSPSALVSDMLNSGQLEVCKRCGRLYNRWSVKQTEDVPCCPHCGESSHFIENYPKNS